MVSRRRRHSKRGDVGKDGLLSIGAQRHDDSGALLRARKQRSTVAQHEERSCFFQEAQRFGEEAPIIAGAGIVAGSRPTDHLSR